jgi:hypothetical protein
VTLPSANRHETAIFPHIIAHAFSFAKFINRIIVPYLRHTGCS